jgi:hypothetical protein
VSKQLSSSCLGEVVTLSNTLQFRDSIFHTIAIARVVTHLSKEVSPKE